MRLLAVTAIVFVIACGSSPTSRASPSPTTSSSALLVYTTWAPDPKVTNGPQPGYKPRLTGLTGHDIQTASAVPDSTGTVWLLNIFFTPHGATLFAELTRENISACPGDPRQSARANCPQRHLTVWLDLTQTDIDAWADPTYVAKVSQPYDLVCLAARSSTAVCSKFLSDPITLQPITGAKTQVGCACTELQANELAAAINSIKAT